MNCVVIACWCCLRSIKLRFSAFLPFRLKHVNNEQKSIVFLQKYLQKHLVVSEIFRTFVPENESISVCFSGGQPGGLRRGA